MNLSRRLWSERPLSASAISRQSFYEAVGISDYTFHTLPQNVSLPKTSLAVQKHQSYRAIFLIYRLNILLRTMMWQTRNLKDTSYNCGFIQALICFALCKFMNRLLPCVFYLDRQRIRKRDTANTSSWARYIQHQWRESLFLISHLDTSFHPIFVLNFVFCERVIHTSNHCTEICALLWFYVA
jgi:hypothetical protein